MEGDSDTSQKLHRGSTLSPFLLALVIDQLTQHIQGEVLWCTLFANYIVLIEEKRGKVNDRLEVWRRTLEFKSFRLSKIKTEYIECEVSGPSHEADVEVRLIHSILGQ